MINYFLEFETLMTKEDVRDSLTIQENNLNIPFI